MLLLTLLLAACGNATCAYAPTACEAGAAASCEGDVLVTCAPFQSTLGLLGDDTELSFPQETDCAATGEVCAVDMTSGAASCESLSAG